MHMKTLSLITAAFFLVLGVAVSHAAATTGGTHVLTRISNETGVPVDTLQTQKSTTGLGYGSLEHANLLANASGQSFDTIVGKCRTVNGKSTTLHGKSTTHFGNSQFVSGNGGRGGAPDTLHGHGGH